MIEMNTELSLKQRVAIAPHRENALSVILPRLLGAIKHDSNALKAKDIYEVTRAGFVVELWLDVQFVWLRLRTDDERRWNVLFFCKLFSGWGGNSFDQRVRVIGWDRSAQHRDWQRKIFEVFQEDTEWLLDIEHTPELPAIVKAVMSDVNIRAGRAVYNISPT